MRHSSLSIYSQLTANHRYSQEVDLHLDHILVSAEEEPNAQDTARWASWFATRPRQRLHRRNSSGIGGYNLHPSSHARLKECGQRGDARAARRQRPQQQSRLPSAGFLAVCGRRGCAKPGPRSTEAAAAGMPPAAGGAEAGGAARPRRRVPPPRRGAARHVPDRPQGRLPPARARPLAAGRLGRARRRRRVLRRRRSYLCMCGRRDSVIRRAATRMNTAAGPLRT